MQSKIMQAVIDEGFQPILITDPPGRIYAEHTHKETKLLVFLEGDMRLVVDGETVECNELDRLIIPGNVVHEAVVGPQGCVFFWSEKLVGQD